MVNGHKAASYKESDFIEKGDLTQNQIDVDRALALGPE